jgi:Mg2+ and Co2+ transporter CorA
MIFLSIILIPIIAFPFIIKLSAGWLSFFEICDWTIVALFVAEYVSKLFLAKNRWAHFKSPWHLVDLIIVILPFVEFVPILGISAVGTPSLLLRLLRVPRALVVGGRAIAGRRGNNNAPAVMMDIEPETVIRQIDVETKATSILNWDELKQHLLDDGKEEWLDIYNISDAGFAILSRLLEIAEPHFKSKLVDEIYPHIDYVEQSSFIFLQQGKIRYPEHASHYLTISRSGIIVICSGTKIITVSRHGIDLSKVLMDTELDLSHKKGLTVPVLYGILEYMLDQYKVMLNEIEMEIFKISSTPRSKLPRDFLARIYQLDKEVTRLVSNLVHFKEMLGIVTSERVPLQGFDAHSEEAFNVLQHSAAYLNEIANDLLANLSSIINLYINQTSFETNRILKILAVITALAVIPSSVGGMLGAGLLDVPFPFYLWQVVLGVGIVLSFAIYMFYKLGWLKT